MSEDSLTRPVRATLTIEIDYDLDSRVSNERLISGLEYVATAAAGDRLFLPPGIGNETVLKGWTSKIEVRDGDAGTGGRS